MFEYTKAGLALNGLISAVKAGDSSKIAKKLAELVRHNPEHIVDNLLGNLKTYNALGEDLAAERIAAATHAIELLVTVIPKIGDILDLRAAQAESIENALLVEKPLPSLPVEKPLSKKASKYSPRLKRKGQKENRKSDEGKRQYQTKNSSKLSILSNPLVLISLVIVFFVGLALLSNEPLPEEEPRTKMSQHNLEMLGE